MTKYTRRNRKGGNLKTRRNRQGGANGEGATKYPRMQAWRDSASRGMSKAATKTATAARGQAGRTGDIKGILDTFSKDEFRRYKESVIRQGGVDPYGDRTHAQKFWKFFSDADTRFDPTKNPDHPKNLKPGYVILWDPNAKRPYAYNRKGATENYITTVDSARASGQAATPPTSQ